MYPSSSDQKAGQISIYNTTSGLLITTYTPAYNLTVNQFGYIAVDSDASTLYIQAFYSQSSNPYVRYPVIFKCSALNITQDCTCHFLSYSGNDYGINGMTMLTSSTLAILIVSYDYSTGINSYQIDTFEI